MLAFVILLKIRALFIWEVINTIQDASDEYYANEGNLSAETMEKFGQMDARDLVNAFMAIQENSDPADSYPDLSDAEMNTVYNSVGGEEQYNNLTSWAADNMDDSALDAFLRAAEISIAELPAARGDLSSLNVFSIFAVLSWGELNLLLDFSADFKTWDISSAIFSILG